MGNGGESPSGAQFVSLPVELALVKGEWFRGGDFDKVAFLQNISAVCVVFTKFQAS